MASGYIMLSLAVLIGAFGAHGLEGQISHDDMDTYKTANFYHFIHGIAVVLTSHILHHYGSRRSLLISNLFTTGILFFSGSLYLMSLSEYLEAPQLKSLGIITPLGGLLFVLAWSLGAWEIIRAPGPNQNEP